MNVDEMKHAFQSPLNMQGIMSYRARRVSGHKRGHFMALRLVDDLIPKSSCRPLKEKRKSMSFANSVVVTAMHRVVSLRVQSNFNILNSFFPIFFF